MKYKDLIHTIRGWMLISLVAVIGIGSCVVTTNANAGAYLDLGISYVDEFGIVERAEINFGDYTISAEASATLEVESFVGMARFGYLFDNGLGIEYEIKGVPDASLEFFNLYYRLEFK